MLKIKKYLILILSICWSITAFIISWYKVELLDTFFIFSLIPYFVLMMCVIALFTLTIMGIVKDKSYINIISLIILIAAGILIIIFPFEDVKFRYELRKYEKPRLEIVNMVKTDKLKSKDENGNVVLPKKYKRYSISGEIVVYQNDKEGQIIAFWVFRGIQSGSTQLMYSTGGEELIKVNETGHPITKIEKLKDKWYLVTTDY